ncbi:MAG: peptidyl-prolyl cis-trans isomerase [Verrucomicrobiota bacterium]
MNAFAATFRLTPLLWTLLALPLAAQNQVAELWAEDRPNGIAAKVEGEIITFEEIRQEMAPLMQQVYRGSANEEDLRRNMKKLERDVLQNLIDQILIVKEFQAKEMTIPKSYLEGEFNDVIQEDFNGERDRFLTYLRSRDKTVRDFRTELEDKIIVQVMKQQMRRNQAEISPEMIKTFYDENENQFQRETEIALFQITLNPEPGGPEVEEKVETVVTLLGDGTSFQEIAKQWSDDGLARRGGSLGWVERSDLREELSDVAFALEVGEVSEPVPFQQSTLFFFVEEVRDEGTIPLPEVRDVIEEILSDKIAREAQESWLQRLREKAYVEYFI